jgi:8-amino-7-oxononanoate synthase
MNEKKFHDALFARMANKNFRRLTLIDENNIDFCSNDYLGLSRAWEVQSIMDKAIRKDEIHGSTGSRLISGNHDMVMKFEKFLAEFHQAESALLFNSGYVANQGLISCIADRHDTIIYDQLVHASLREGVQYTLAASFSFRHNDLAHLEERLKNAKGNVFVVVESIYSMDGDEAPLVSMTELCATYGAALVVDEAHATGVFGHQGRGLVNALGLESKIWARIYTFGKALGSHGAVVVGPNYLRDYLVNFSKPFIYTTALPAYHYIGVWRAYEMMMIKPLTEKIQKRIRYFLKQIPESLKASFIPSRSAIQCMLLPGNAQVKTAAETLQKAGYAVVPILHPTVPAGQERLRICLHTYNTKAQINGLIAQLGQLQETTLN